MSQPQGAGHPASPPATKRLLVLSYHAPPSPAVGGLRWWGLTKYLARVGWDVTMLTHGQPEDTSGPPGVRVVRVPRRRTMQDRYQSWRSRGPSAPDGARPAEGEVAPAAAASSSWISTVRRELSEVLSFPDDARGWLREAVAAGRVLVQEGAPDVIVSTGPPHSLHAIARLLGTESRTRFVMDYRDPWRGQPFSKLATAALGVVEDGLVSGVDLLTCTTPELVEGVRRRNKSARTRWLSNGCDAELLPARERPAPGSLEVLHLGTLYANRTPVPLLRAFAHFRTTEPDLASRACLRFIGTVEAEHRAEIDAARSNGAGGQILLEPPTSRPKALAALARTHLAVVLAIRQHELVPAKLFESVAMGVPTLVITEAGSATAGAAERVGAIHHTPDDVEGMTRTFAAAARGELEGRASKGSAVSHESLAREADRLFRELLEGTAR